MTSQHESVPHQGGIRLFRQAGHPTCWASVLPDTPSSASFPPPLEPHPPSERTAADVLGRGLRGTLHGDGVRHTIPFYNWVVSQAGSPPQFWGRYLNLTGAIAAAEVDYLHSRAPYCRILLIYQAPTVDGNYLQGVADANDAIGRADALNVPAGVMLFADVEANTSPTAAWLQGWANRMFTSKYGGAGGFYASTHSTSTFITAYATACLEAPSLMAAARIYSAVWVGDCTPASAAPAFAPPLPASNPETVLFWQFKDKCWPNSPAEGADQDLALAEGLALLW